MGQPHIHIVKEKMRGELRMTETPSISILEEHLFWLEIIQDHAYFVRDHLSPIEVQWVAAAEQYIQLFEGVLEQLSRVNGQAEASSSDMIALAKASWPVTSGYFQLEGQLQNLRIQNKVNVSLTPTYLNGTLNENQEYIRMLSFYVNGQTPPPLSLVDLMDLWLEDQLGHAVLLRNILDPIEGAIIKQVDSYISKFQLFMVQNHHMRNFLRFSPPNMPRQHLMALEVGQTTIEMNECIQQVVRRFRGTELLSRTTLRFLEHHFPETCYFIKKLSLYAPELSPAAAGCSLRKPSFQ